MKCKWCGAAVSLDDEFCPYCGALNEPARKHIEDMRKFSSDYSATRKEVLGNVEKQSGKHRKIITIAVLALLNIIVLVGTIGIDDIGYYIKDIKLRSQASEYSQIMQDFERDGDYRSLSRYYSDLYLYSEDSLKHYDAVAEMARYLCKAEDDMYYLTGAGDSYMTEGELIQNLAGSVAGFYDIYAEKERDWWPERFSAEHLQSMQKMEESLLSALKTYCGLSDEELALIPEAESQSILFMIGRSLGYYE